MDDPNDIAEEITSDLESGAELTPESPSEATESAPEESTDSSQSEEAPAPAENNEDQAIKKAQAVGEGEKPARKPAWNKELERFHDDINGILATKENLKLVALDKNARQSFSRLWRTESNRFFQLAVNIRRRKRGVKMNGKSVA
jgi:hypothetical protein